MNLRYAVWIELPFEMVELLRDFYIKKSGKKLPVKNLHLSILWPFYLNAGVTEEIILEKLKNILFENFEAKLLKLLVWEQKNKKILVVEMEPKSKFQKIFGEILMVLRKDIVFDKSVFSEGLLPDFLPHITLNYNFDGDISGWNEQELGKYSFTVDKIGLYREEERGKWLKVWVDSGSPSFRLKPWTSADQGELIVDRRRLELLSPQCECGTLPDKLTARWITDQVRDSVDYFINSFGNNH